MVFNRLPESTIPSLFIFVFFFYAPVRAQDSVAVGELQEHGFKCQVVNAGRYRISLDGDWLVSTDNGKNWQTIQVPSSLEENRTTIFKKRLYIPADFINHDVFSLHIGNGGVSTEVRVNNEFVAIHNGAYSPINTRIPDRLLQTGSENIIEIICNNELNPVSTIPLRQLAFQPVCYGGLFRSVYLTAEPPIYMSEPTADVSLSPDFGSASVVSDVHVYASDLPQFGLDTNSVSVVLKVDATLLEKSTGRIVAKSEVETFSLDPNHNTTVRVSLGIKKPELWSPSQPNLYEIDFHLYRDKTVMDESSMSVGFRKFGISENKFLVNGNPTFIKSVNYVVDYPGEGAAESELEIEKDIAVIKTLGGNAIRVANYPPSDALLDFCDRFGLMVFEEIPVVDVPPSVLASSQYRGSIRGYLSEVIRNARSHPSIAAISVGTGLDQGAVVTREYIASCASLIHDASDWLVYYTSLPGIIDAIKTSADFVGIDLSPFTTQQEMKNFLTKQSDSAPHTTFWVSSIGAQAQMDNHNGYSDPLSLEHQARYLVDGFNLVEQGSFAGISVNSFADWRGAVPHLMPNDHPYLYTFGLVSYWREKRAAFAVVRGLFSDEALPTLPIGDYPDAPPIIYVVLSTLLLVLITYLHYSRRWFRESATRAIFRPYNFFADVRDQRVISAFQTAMVLVLISAGVAIYLSSLAYEYRNSYVFDRMLGILIPSNALKIRLDYLVWHPAQFILAFMILFMALAAIVTVIIKIISYVVKIRLELVSAFTISIWSLLPMAVLILVDMILFRLLGESGFVWGALIFFAALCLLSLFRLFHGIGIIYDLPTLRIGLIGSLVLIAIVVLITIYYNGTDGVIPYAKLLYKFIAGNRVA